MRRATTKSVVLRLNSNGVVARIKAYKLSKIRTTKIYMKGELTVDESWQFNTAKMLAAVVHQSVEVISVIKSLNKSVM